MKFLLAILLISPVAAQEALPWSIDVDDTAIESSVTNATAGDWYEVELFNFDDVTHFVTIGPFGTFEVPSLESVDAGPFQMGTESFTISDDVTGTSMDIQVTEADFVDEESNASSSENASQETPLPVGLALAALVGVVLRRK